MFSNDMFSKQWDRDFADAKANGLTDEAATAAADAKARGFTNPTPASDTGNAQEAEAKVTLTTWQDWDPKDVPAREWIIEQWLPAGRVALFTGKGGRGKSSLALMLAAAVATDATNAQFLGQPVRLSGKVVFASWEDEKAEMVRRLQRVSGQQADALDGRLVGVDLAGCGPLWEPPHRATTDTPGQLSQHGAALCALASGHKARLLVIDPVAAAFAGNENHRGLVRAYMSYWDKWARENQCAVLQIAHPPKNAASYSGSTDWHSAARVLWSLGYERDEEAAPDNQTLQLCCEKSNYGRLPAPMQIERTDNGAFELVDYTKPTANPYD